MRTRPFAICAFALLVLAAVDAFAGAPWPQTSVHHVAMDIETERGVRTTLAATGGRVRIVTMFYASCPMACPLIVDALRHIDRKLDARERQALSILMVTLDPERDTPAALRELASRRGIDSPRWTLARVSPADTRKLAAALGIRYRLLDDGSFDHSSVLVLLDEEGRVLARSTALGVDPVFLDAVRAALRTRPLVARSPGRSEGKAN